MFLIFLFICVLQCILLIDFQFSSVRIASFVKDFVQITHYEYVIFTNILLSLLLAQGMSMVRYFCAIILL